MILYLPELWSHQSDFEAFEASFDTWDGALSCASASWRFGQSGGWFWLWSSLLNQMLERIVCVIVGTAIMIVWGRGFLWSRSCVALYTGLRIDVRAVSVRCRCKLTIARRRVFDEILRAARRWRKALQVWDCRIWSVRVVSSNTHSRSSGGRFRSRDSAGSLHCFQYANQAKGECR